MFFSFQVWTNGPFDLGCSYKYSSLECSISLYNFFLFFSKFRKYKSATVHFSRPFNEKYCEDFKKGIGDALYDKIILHMAEVKCSIIPFQSAAFTLGCNNALVKIHSGAREEREVIFNGLSK